VKKGTTPARDLLTWSGRFGEGPVTSFGDPVSTTDYELCVYDDADGTPDLRLAPRADHGGLCGGKPCWKAIGSGFRYSDAQLTRGSMQLLKLGGGLNGRATISAKAKGAQLAIAPLPLATDVVVQLKSSGGQCWQSSFATPTKTDTLQFKATR
jgi:hypothetical protein